MICAERWSDMPQGFYPVTAHRADPGAAIGGAPRGIGPSILDSPAGHDCGKGMSRFLSTGNPKG